jgi:hypothetical protein
MEHEQAMGRPDFGWALEQLKKGKKAARRGWNGKDMYIYLQKGSIIADENIRNQNMKTGQAEVEILPHIDMKTADGKFLCGWLASQTDMLSEDWEIVK